MKRPAPVRKPKRSGDVRKDLTESQLAWIASVALTFNEAEFLLDVLIGSSLSLGKLSNEITSRINGVDGKIEIAKLSVKQLDAPEIALKLLGETLGDGGFALLKKYRDRIIHARIIDAVAAIGRSPAQRGKFDEILLTTPALEGVYKRLQFIRLELRHILLLVHELIVARMIDGPSPIPSGKVDVVDKRRERTELEIQGEIAQCRGHQKDRLSLPPLPEFPSESELREADEMAAQAQQADFLKYLGPLPEHLKNRQSPQISDKLWKALSKNPPK